MSRRLQFSLFTNDVVYTVVTESWFCLRKCLEFLCINKIVQSEQVSECSGALEIWQLSFIWHNLFSKGSPLMKMVNVILRHHGLVEVWHQFCTSTLCNYVPAWIKAARLRECLAVRRLPNKNPESFGVNFHHVYPHHNVQHMPSSHAQLLVLSIGSLSVVLLLNSQ